VARIVTTNKPRRTLAELEAMCSPHSWVGLVGERAHQAEQRGEAHPARCVCGWEGSPRQSFQTQLEDHGRHQMAAMREEDDG
jgi:hypothetical protein